MLRPLLPSTLFPYTTLFRSPEHLDRQVGLREAVEVGDRVRRRDQAPLVVDVVAERDHAARPAAVADAPVPSGRGDRKSTRLNSSHVSISYAVFCLKKKNNSS